MKAERKLVRALLILVAWSVVCGAALAAKATRGARISSFPWKTT